MQSIASDFLWPAFLIFVALMLALDLGVFHRKPHRVSLREAIVWSAVWVGLAAAFNAGIYAYFGWTPALEFATSYLIEKSLAIDNIFIFAMVFAIFGVPATYQHRVLFWGVIGAVILRAAMVSLGPTLLEHADWTLYVFGGLLILTGIRFAFFKLPLSDGAPPKWVRRLGHALPIYDKVESDQFFVRRGSRLLATPLVLALIVVEFGDVVFAVDSIPAIFGATQDPFIIFTSNIFAVLGLRAMYSLLANLLDDFIYLRQGLATVLIFLGLKILVGPWFVVPGGASLGIIVLVLATAILTSIVVNPMHNIERDRLRR